MRDFKNFRPLNEAEIRIIYYALDQISSNITLFIEKRSLTLFCSRSIQNGRYLVYLISKKLRNSIFSFHNDVKISSAGLFMGFIKQNTFFLSLEGAEFFLTQNLIPVQKILNVTNKAEKAILYGNPIVKSNILNISSDLKKNAIMLVLNESRELIAIARSEVDYTNFKILKQGDLAAINLNDKGYYLRRKQ